MRLLLQSDSAAKRFFQPSINAELVSLKSTLFVLGLLAVLRESSLATYQMAEMPRNEALEHLLEVLGLRPDSRNAHGK